MGRNLLFDRPVLIYSMVDQSVVSAANFLTTILIGRASGASELGIYAVCFAIILFASAACESVVISPYMVLVRSLPATRQALYGGSMLLHQGVMALISSALVLLAAGALFLMDGNSSLHDGLLALALALPAVLAREFGRRFSMAHMRPENALVVDVTTAALQLAGLAGLAWVSALSVGSALLVISFANLSAVAVWYIVEHPILRFSLHAAIEDLNRNLRLGAWNFVAFTTFIAQLYIAPWVLASLADPSMIGLFAACHSIVMLSNPLTQGIANNLMPRCARATSEADQRETRKLVYRYTWVLAVIMVAMCAPIGIFGSELLSILYGSEFSGAGATVIVLAAAAVARGVAMSVYIGLWATGHSDLNARVNLTGLLVQITGLVLLFPVFGLVGAGLAVLTADISAALARFLLFRNAKLFIVGAQPV